ncbi:hypothetical protein ACLB2K_018851 [Fragaria x ananassa]
MKLQRRMIVLLFLAVLVSGYKENSTTTTTPVSVHDQLQNSSENLEAKHEVNEEKKRWHHYSFEAFFANKRRVPNASDPLHNR